MTLAFDARQHLFYVVETSDAALAQREPFRVKVHLRAVRSVKIIESCPQHVIDDVLERHVAFAPFSLEADGNVVVERQRRTHDVMLVW